MKKPLMIILMVVLLVVDMAIGFSCWSYAEHGSLPKSISYTGYYIPVGFSINRMDDGFYVVAISWKCNTLAFEHGGIHIYGG